jgi:hypothetical protein
MEDVLQYQKPAMKKGAYSHILTQIRPHGRANLLRLGKGLHSLVLIMEKNTSCAVSNMLNTHSNWKVHT